MPTAESKNVPPLQASPSLLAKIGAWFKRQFWLLHPNIHLHLNLPPSQAYRLLELGAKPSINRLEYRNLFTNGRRYHLQTEKNNGFQMMTTHKIWWYPRSRSSASSVLHGEFEILDEHSSRLTLHSNIRLFYFLDIFPIPSFFTSILVFMLWPIWLLTFLILALYLLSWLGHRLNAILEAHEMRYFIQTILENYMPPPPAQLNGSSADIVLEEEFVRVWDKFVEEKRQE